MCLIVKALVFPLRHGHMSSCYMEGREERREEGREEGRERREEG